MTVGVRGCVCPWSESTAQKTMVGGEENASQHPPQGRCLSPNEDDVFITIGQAERVRLEPWPVAHWVTAASPFTEVVALISGQGTYKKQAMLPQ